VLLQGTVLSAFFWGYAMTQVLGGYMSDRIGGATVLLTAAVGWALLTFWTPRIVYVFSDKSTALAFVVLSRVLVGALQGESHNGSTRLHFIIIVSVLKC
jgi:ACS family sodium-dependent inorganic phosphate cotransporter-like MFS transporter 9